ncbi:MAG: GGDEF domain-containing protein [Planctomycetales bacterium]|nr:GGDEF domain-containing protein [Planctomycetales bacterium]
MTTQASVKGAISPLRRTAVTFPRTEDAWGAFLSFVRAFLRGETYLPHRNLFFVFGFLWGVPVPVVTLAVDLHARNLAFSLASCLECYRTSPAVHGWFLLHPFLFAAVFGAAGTVARDRGRQIESLVRRLRTVADTDALTGLYNHRVFQERIRQEAARAEREGRPLSLLMADLDHFKDFNDLYGHPAGDDLLRALARRLRSLVRPYDILCRYGGEEFAAILIGMDSVEAERAAERVRAGVADEPFRLALVRGFEQAFPVSLSVGVATREPGESVPYWIARADRRLYEAKRAGRNRVCSRDPL